MEIIQTVQDGVIIVALQGRLDTNTSVSLEEKLMTLTREASHKIVIDFSQLDFISSSGLRVLLTAAKQSKRVSGRIVLSGLKDHVRQVFDVAGFTMLFTICPTQEEALESLA